MLVSEWVLIGTIILFLAWLITLLLRTNAGMRHMTWLIAFSALIVLPGVTAIVPSSQIFRLSATAFPSTFSSGIGEKTLDAAQVQNSRATHAKMPSKEWGTVAFGLICLWAMGFVTVSFQRVLALYRLGIHRRSSVRYSLDALDPAELAAKVGLKRRWDLRICDTSTVASAMTWGNRNPIVLLPKSSIFWPKDRLEAVLLHELAHVRRYDSLSQLLAFAGCALYWFNPAVWLCSRAMRAEAEVAADDAVLHAGIRPSFYAAELLRFASELGQHSQQFRYMGISFMRQPKIEKRIRSIVDPSRGRLGVSLTRMLTAGGIGLFSVIALATVRPSMALLGQSENSLPSADSYRPSQTSDKTMERDRSQMRDRAETRLPLPQSSSDSVEFQAPPADNGQVGSARLKQTEHSQKPEPYVSPDAVPATTNGRGPDPVGSDLLPASADSLPRKSNPGGSGTQAPDEPAHPSDYTQPNQSADRLPTNPQ
jgi:beta-lactamase regulating signal transducer with metallopeptidase domain